MNTKTKYKVNVSFEEMKNEVINHRNLCYNNGLITTREYLQYNGIKTIGDCHIYKRHTNSTSAKIMQWCHGHKKSYPQQLKRTLFIERLYKKFTATAFDLDEGFYTQEKVLNTQINDSILDDVINASSTPKIEAIKNKTVIDTTKQIRDTNKLRAIEADHKVSMQRNTSFKDNIIDVAQHSMLKEVRRNPNSFIRQAKRLFKNLKQEIFNRK